MKNKHYSILFSLSIMVLLVWYKPAISNITPGNTATSEIIVKNKYFSKAEVLKVLVKINENVAVHDITNQWQVRLVESRAYNEVQALTQWVDADRIYAHFSLDLSKSKFNSLRMFSQIRLKREDDGFSEVIESKQPIYIQLIEKAAIEVKLKTYEKKKQTEVYLKILNRIDEIGAIEWLAQINGADWVKIKSKDEDNKLRLDYDFEPGQHRIMAKVYNKSSGDFFDTDYVNLSVFYEPKIILSAPSYALVSDEVKVSALASYHGDPVLSTELRYEWSTDNGDNWEAGQSTKFVSVRNNGQIKVSVRVRFIDPPIQGADKRRYAEKEATINFKKTRPVLVSLNGPHRVEEGKTYFFNAETSPPYPDMINGVSGYFMLPNGSVIYGTETEYKPTQKDIDMETNSLKISYIGWVNGFRERTETTKTITPKFWQYDWPEFKFKFKKTYDYVPTNITLKASHNGNEYELDDLNYKWDINNKDVSVIDESRDYMRIVNIKKAGTYTFSYTVNDSRDNTSTRELIVTVKDSPKLKINPKITFGNKYKREPLDISIKLDLEGGHPLDRPKDVTYNVNGKSIKVNEKDDVVNFKLNAGKKNIGIKVVSLMGYETQFTIPVNVQKNFPPECAGKMSDYLNHYVFATKCLDQDGIVEGREWFIDGEKVAKKGEVLSLAKLSYPSPPLVEFVGIDDSGSKSNIVNFK
jgi:hypothetical protein